MDTILTQMLICFINFFLFQLHYFFVAQHPEEQSQRLLLLPEEHSQDCYCLLKNSLKTVAVS